MFTLIFVLSQTVPGEEALESKTIPTLLSSLGFCAGYMRAPKLVGNGAVGGAFMNTREWWQSSGFYMAAEGYSGGGKMGADLEMGGWQRFYVSRGKSFSGHLGLGFSMHATPQFFETEEWNLEGIRAGLSASGIFVRTITEDFSLVFWIKYGIVTSPGTPNYLSLMVGGSINNPF